MEQPKQFYAFMLAMTLLGDESEWIVWLAWAYVVVRMVHSVVHSRFNDVLLLRSPGFAVSSLLLVGLEVRGAMVVFS